MQNGPEVASILSDLYTHKLPFKGLFINLFCPLTNPDSNTKNRLEKQYRYTKVRAENSHYLLQKCIFNISDGH